MNDGYFFNGWLLKKIFNTKQKLVKSIKFKFI